MLISSSSQSLVLLFLCIVIIEYIYFIGMNKFMTMSSLDIFIIVIFNLLFIYIITSDILDNLRYINLPEKPKGQYLGLGSNLQEYIWGMFYDYKVIVNRHDRKEMVL